MLCFKHPKGIRFQCQRCALCCGDTPTHVRHALLLESEAERIADVLSKRVEEFAAAVQGHEPYSHEVKKTAKDGRCIFLDDDCCTIYEMRPLVCRFYPFELKTGTNGKPEFSHAQECQGIGKGQELSRKFFESLFRQAQERFAQSSAKTNRHSPSG